MFPVPAEVSASFVAESLAHPGAAAEVTWTGSRPLCATARARVLGFVHPGRAATLAATGAAGLRAQAPIGAFVELSGAVGPAWARIPTPLVVVDDDSAREGGDPGRLHLLVGGTLGLGWTIGRVSPFLHLDGYGLAHPRSPVRPSVQVAVGASWRLE